MTVVNAPMPATLDAEPPTRPTGDMQVPAVAAASRMTTTTTRHVVRLQPVIHPSREATPTERAAREGIELATQAACRDEDDGKRCIASTMALVLTARAEEVWLHLGALDRDPRPRRGYWTHRRANLGARVGASSFFAERPDSNDPGRTGAQIWGRAPVRPFSPKSCRTRSEGDRGRLFARMGITHASLRAPVRPCRSPRSVVAASLVAGVKW